MSRIIYLPSLISINIKNFSLYPQDLDFTYNFVKGVNLIVGGNGMGKTTFITLIKYGLLGLYQKEIDVRTYKERKIEKRKQYSNEFFRNRMNKEESYIQNAKVTIKFITNDILFEVTRGLYDIILQQVKITQNGIESILPGAIISQHKYEKLSDEEKQKCLQYNYETKVKDAANLYSFDDLIFFINNILTFGETRKTILWDYKIQEALSSKYFNDPELDNKYEEGKRQAKYHDSIARHKSEDIRAINQAIEKNMKKNENLIDILEINEKIKNYKKRIDLKTRELEGIQKDRKELGNTLKIKLASKANAVKELQEIEAKMKSVENNLYKELWQKLNPNYHLFYKSIKINNICPMCNKELETETVQRILEDENKCILCNKTITDSTSSSGNRMEYENKTNDVLKKIQNLESEIFNFENEIEILDLQYNQCKIELNNQQRELRDLDYILQNRDTKNNEEFSFKMFLNSITELEAEKKFNQDQSKYYSEESNKIAQKMDQNREMITRELSSIFSDYVEKFLGMNSILSYDNHPEEDGRLYVPIVGNSPRYFQEELSESQSFFADQSFRMSLLNHFYSQPSFFICETPDSSLDISNEMNAANIFLKYLEMPNSLIITSNLNNSEFLEFIIDNAKTINYINLLKIGKCSQIQQQSSKLYQISSRIEEKINAKRNHE